MTNTTRTLILTGWGWKDYACAAALTLRHHKQADVLGMSTRRLPEFLSEVGGYQEIVILGVGLTGDPGLLAKALAKLAGKKVRVSWISVLPVAGSLGPDIRSKLDIVVDEGAESLTDAVSRAYSMPAGDLAQILQENKPTAAAQKIHLLLDAAMYMYRNYQDEEAYSTAIRHIANGDDESLWSEAERGMVEHFLRFGSRELVGKSDAIQNLLGQINLIAPKDRSRVLIYGESGTGKETVALQIHNKSPRHKEPFIPFNCANVSPDLLESRFLGYEKGAFTGAAERKRGIFEQADGGTLFLDEIGELPIEAQGLLLRVLEGGRFTRVGEGPEVVVDVRLVTATHRDLAAMVQAETFRRDLYFRINTFPIRTPALHERASDIPLLAESLLGRVDRKTGRRFTAAAQTWLTQQRFSGNIRELRNLIERASLLADGDMIDVAHLQEMTDSPPILSDEVPLAKDDAFRVEYILDLDELERRYLAWSRSRHQGEMSELAQQLGVSPRTLYRKLAG